MELGDILNDEVTAEIPFEVNGKVDPEAVVELLFIANDEFTRILGRARTREIFKGQVITDTDTTKGQVMLGRKVVKGWKGFKSLGKDFPYTQENCDALMRRRRDFIDFVVEKCTDMMNFLQEAQEEGKKKLKPTESG